MIKDNSSLMKAKILSIFTREMILSSKNVEIFRLEEILRESGKPLEQRIVVLSQEEIKQKIKEKVKLKLSKPKERLFDQKKFLMEPSKQIRGNINAMVPPERQIQRDFKRKQSNESISGEIRVPKRILRIPEVNLPERLRDLKPVAASQSLDLGRLNILINDPNVVTIETQGEEEKVIVTGKMGKKPTNIILSKEEISEIINRFSTEARIPQHEGLFKTVVGSLILTAIISQSTSSSFIIKKLSKNNSNFPPVPRP